MKAWLLKDFEGLDQLHIAQVSDPIAGKGEVVLQIELAGLNPADRHLAEGRYPAKPALPHILGRDGIGTIISLGAGVTQFKAGDRAIILRREMGVTRPGTFAEKVAVPIESLAPVPVGWSDQEAGGAALVYLTAYQALTQWGTLPPSVVLVTGASGGVGVAAIQLATAAKHTTVALSRSSSKRDQLKEIGASICLDPGDSNWPAQLKSELGNRRVDLVIDNVGSSLFSEVIGTLGQDSKVSVVGASAGQVPQFNTATLFFRRIRIGGVSVGAYSPGESQGAWKAIVEIMARAKARPIVDSVFPFGKLIEAFEKLAKGPMGKVLLSIDTN